jgi:catechol 2,3-dioxygenase-like lactoylglutathione lyase family enzyme
VPRAPIHHVDLVVSDVDRSLRFYRQLLEPLGWNRLGKIVGERGETVWYVGGRGAGPGLRARQSDAHPAPYDRYALGVHHIAFDASSREVVDERHEWLLANGAVIESPPKAYDYMPGYYAVFFYDPDGIKLEVVHVPDR